MKRTTFLETDISLANVRCRHGRQRSGVARPVAEPDLYVTVTTRQTVAGTPTSSATLSKVPIARGRDHRARVDLQRGSRGRADGRPLTDSAHGCNRSLIRGAVPGDQRGLVQGPDLLPAEPVFQPLRLHV